MDSCYDFSEDSEMSAKIEATIADLYRVPENGKAEIVDGELVLMPPTGDMPARAGFEIAVSLRRMKGRTPGRAYPDNAGFLVAVLLSQSFWAGRPLPEIDALASSLIPHIRSQPVPGALCQAMQQRERSR